MLTAVNVVVTGTLNQSDLCLDVTAEGIFGVCRSRENMRLPSYLIRGENPKIAITLFESGSIGVSGAKSIEEALLCIKYVTEKLTESFLFGEVKLEKYSVSNIVATCKLDYRVNLEKSVISLKKAGFQVSYEPEMICGIQISDCKMRGNLILFSTGSVNLLGARNLHVWNKALERIIKFLVPERERSGPNKENTRP